MSMEPCGFSAVKRKIGINPYVEIPEHVSVSFGKRGYVPVVGTLNEITIRATLVPIGNGRHRLYINGDMRKKAKVTVGDEIHLKLTHDTEPQKVPIPRELTNALKRNERALAAFESLPPSHRKEIHDHLNYLKTPEALRRNVDKVLKSIVKAKTSLKN